MSKDNFEILLDRCLLLQNYLLHDNGYVCFYTEEGEILIDGYYKNLPPIMKDLALKIWGQKLLDSDFNFLSTEG